MTSPVVDLSGFKRMTPEEFASEFFQDTGTRKSTNWTKLRDLYRLNIQAAEAEAFNRGMEWRRSPAEEFKNPATRKAR